MDIKKYICNICNKNYKTYKSMWNHKKNIHDNKKNNDLNMTFNQLKKDHSMTNNIQLINNLDDIEENKLTDNTICMFCNKKLSAYTHLRRHLKTCKIKNNIQKENEELKKITEMQALEMSEMRKSLEELKKNMLDMMNKKCKMHPKSLQKMINSNNTINMTINNNIEYVEIGDEELYKVFSKKEKMKILCDIGSAIEKIITFRSLHLFT